MKKLRILTFTMYWFLFLAWCTWWNNTSYKTSRTCKDVTSYDHNRDNDMKCTSTNWDVKYTSYEWAKVLESL